MGRQYGREVTVDVMTVTEPSPTPESPVADTAVPAPESVPPADDSAVRAEHRATSVLVGAATAALDRLNAPRRNKVGLREVAVGAVFELEDAATGLLSRIRRPRSGDPRPRPVVRLAVLLERAQYGVVRLAQ